MSSTLEASVFMGKSYSGNLHSIKNTGNDLTLKQMFDMSEKLIVGQSDEILDNYLWSMMKKSSVYRMQKFKYFRILCYVLEKWIRTQHQIRFGKNSWVGSKIHHNTELWTQLTENRWNSSGIFSQDSPHCSSSTMSKVHKQNGRPIKIPRTNYLHVDVQWHHMGDLHTMNGNTLLTPHLWLYLQKDFQEDVGHSSDLDQKQSGILLTSIDHEEDGTESLKLMMIKFRESGHPVFRATSPLSRGTPKSKGGGKLSIHFCADGDTIGTVFSTIISVNQLSIFGAVSDLCEEFSTCQARTGRPVLAGQSDTLFEPAILLTTTPTPSIEVPAQEILLHKYKERVERLSQQDRVMKICTDAGFLKAVEVGQYFMTKDTDEFSQLTEPVTCREYTLPRDEKSTDPHGWIWGNTKIELVLEVTTSYLQGKYGVEIRIESVNKDNSHSWVRISHGLNKLVTDLIDKEYDDNEQETCETKTEAFALKTNVLAFASRSKAKAKPRRPTSACSSTRTVPIHLRIWTDIEPGTQSNQAYPVAKSLLRHGQLPWEEDGAIEFWRLKDDLRNDFENSQCWSDENVEEQDGRRRRQQEKISILYGLVRTRNSLSPSSSRSFRTMW